MTGFGTSKRLVDVDQMFILHLVLQLLDQTQPTGVSDMLRQFAVFQRVFHFQYFDYHRLVFVNESSGQIVLDVSTSVRLVLMRLGQLQPR